MFQDRYDAGMQLVGKLKMYKDDPDAIVFAIPRGGYHSRCGMRTIKSPHGHCSN